MCTPARRGGRCDLMRSQVMRKSIRFIGPVSESKHTPLFRSIESCRVPCERSPWLIHSHRPSQRDRCSISQSVTVFGNVDFQLLTM